MLRNLAIYLQRNDVSLLFRSYTAILNLLSNLPTYLRLHDVSSSYLLSAIKIVKFVMIFFPMTRVTIVFLFFFLMRFVFFGADEVTDLS